MPGLLEPGWVAAPDGHRFLLGVAVPDVDVLCAAAAAQASRCATVRETGRGRVRTAAPTDPAGHLWEVAGPLPS